MPQDRIGPERFDGCWARANVHAERITYRPIPDSTVRLANLRAGALDVIERISPSDVGDIRRGQRALIRLSAPDTSDDLQASEAIRAIAAKAGIDIQVIETAARAAAYDRATRIYLADRPSINLWQPLTLHGAGASIQGLRAAPDGIIRVQGLTGARG